MSDAVHDRTPVIVGVAQRTWNATADALAPEPVQQMVAMLNAAALDAEPSTRLLGRATGLWTVDVASWPYTDVPAAVAEKLGIAPNQLLTSKLGGEQPQALFGRAADAIARGEHDVVLIAGAEAFRTRRLSGQPLPSFGGQGVDVAALKDVFNVDRDPSHPAEAAAGARVPIDYYPLFDTALRGGAGRSMAEHRELIGELWAGLAKVAADNPHATLRSAPSAAEILEVGPGNRMIAYPYTKLMTSNIFVDMGAAVILCSAGVARDLGIPRDRWVFPLTTSCADDIWFPSDRARLDRSPAIRANAAAAFEASGYGIDDIAHLDLYSCFPSAVQLAAIELGLPIVGGDRALSSTGGLTFFGGPGSNYSTHGLVSLVEKLREDAGSLGLLTGLGMFFTKHTLGLYSTTPPAQFAHSELGTVSDGERPTLTDYAGPATLETYTVRHGADGLPVDAILVGFTAAGERVWGNTKDPVLLDALEREDLLGTSVEF
ncbi:MAG: acetyl-CoA acetyltransferase [Sporichthyaceae bacterium]